MSGGVSTRTRARKAVSDGNQPVGDGVRETTVVSLSLDSESEDMSAVSSQDVEFGQWNDFDYGRDQGKDKEMAEAEKDNSEKGEEEQEQEPEEEKENSEKGEEEEEQEPEKEKENSESAEKGQENVDESEEEDSLTSIREKARVQGEDFWRKLDSESDDEKEAEKREKTPTPLEKEAEKKSEETPTPLRGRTKAAAARRQSHTPPENWIKPPAVEAPEKKPEKTVKADKEVEEPEEAAKPNKGAVRTGIHHRPKVMAVNGGKKRGRPKKTAATLKPCTPLPEKRKGEPSRWVQSPFTEGKSDELEVPKKKPKTKA
ncbi:hypothetical protein Bca52824_018411 [Brassica carinata]|uniref:Uncharacterized protein n=1 Tax=Brassica carinata TaxID=52824 RepID=A0A8X7VQ12_BRACI|nr:hypothetical protein Bca52824_018411 [Brassica carinata]